MAKKHSTIDPGSKPGATEKISFTVASWVTICIVVSALALYIVFKSSDTPSDGKGAGENTLTDPTFTPSTFPPTEIGNPVRTPVFLPTEPTDKPGGTDEGGTDKGGTDEGGTDEGGTDEGGTDEGNDDRHGHSGSQGAELCAHSLPEQANGKPFSHSACPDD